MRLNLQPHPSTPTDLQLSVSARTDGQGLHLVYILSGDLSSVVIPPPAARVRTDDLWRTTCFELFLDGAGRGYREFNFSPSGAWAAYEFDGYRSGMQATGLPELPECDAEIQPDGLHVTASIMLGERLEELKIGLSAVVELTSGTRLFFALAHPPGAPDFHHQACFAATLPPIEQA